MQLYNIDKNHAMIDCETLAVGVHNPALLSIGVSIFTGHRIVETTQYFIDVDDALKHGVVTGGTLKFWLSADDYARGALLEGQRMATLLNTALNTMRYLLMSYDVDTIWGNGALEDLRWVASAYAALGHVAPWRYDQTRCFRTIKNALDRGKEFKVDPRIQHDAACDAQAQAKWLINIQAGEKVWQH